MTQHQHLSVFSQSTASANPHYILWQYMKSNILLPFSHIAGFTAVRNTATAVGNTATGFAPVATLSTLLPGSRKVIFMVVSGNSVTNCFCCDTNVET